MTARFAMVTASSEQYFYYAQGLILSLREKPQGADAPICFFDLGCNARQLDWLRAHVNCIAVPEWDFDFPARATTKDYRKAGFVRPYLCRYFPDYDIHLWMDSDTWVQDYRAVERYFEGARSKGFAVAPELHPAYAGCTHRSAQLRQFMYESYEAPYGREIAERYHNYAVLNTGVFAMHRDSPLRPIWIERLSEGLQRSQHFMIDLVSINLALYENYERFYPDQVEYLPASCNWMSHQALPLFDEETKQFVDPQVPHDPIGVMHRTSDDLKRLGRVELRTLQGHRMHSSLEYRDGAYSAEKPADFKGWQDKGWAMK
jgi:hypothetical protein